MSDSDADNSKEAFRAADEARLIGDLDMHVNAARIIAEGLAETDGVIREQAERWLAVGTIPSMEADGVTIEEAIEKGWSSDPVSALLLMEDLQRDPARIRR